MPHRWGSHPNGAHSLLLISVNNNYNYILSTIYNQYFLLEHETLEGVQVSDVKSDLNVPQEFEVGTEEIRSN